MINSHVAKLRKSPMTKILRDNSVIKTSSGFKPRKISNIMN